MKIHHGEKVSLNCFNKNLLIYEKKRMSKENNRCDIYPSMCVAEAFVSDIGLYFSNKDFQSVPLLIGSGFFAEVYLLHNISLNIDMAFKVPKPTESINNFFKEIKLLKSLNHENILRFYGSCLYNGIFGYLTEYLDSGSLSSMIEKEGFKLDWFTRVNIAKDIASGLVYMHEHFIVHRDLSAENILLHKLQSNSNEESAVVHYRAVIADFGLFLNMKHIRADRMATVGNPFYTAPENLKNKTPYTYSSDVFSFGMILCEIITGLRNDPNLIPRTKNYGLDYKKLPTKSDCPKWISGLACNCCMVHVYFRPTMQRAYSIIAENQPYISFWHRGISFHKTYSEMKQFNQTRAMSLSISQHHHSFHIHQGELCENVEDDFAIDEKSLNNPLKACRKMYRNNSVDSLLDSRFLDFAKTYEDPGYIDKPLTKSMKNLDPRIHQRSLRCSSESGFRNLHRHSDLVRRTAAYLG